MKRAIVTVGLGFGDEGKGATVDFLCRLFKADLVIRYSGGSQCGHNVQLPDGRRHTFSQFGSGVFSKTRTFIGPQVIVYPEAMHREGESLKKNFSDIVGKTFPMETACGMKMEFNLNVMDWVTVHPRCLVTTPYHRAVNRLREIYRGRGKHGSCGHGIGETRSYWLKYGEDAIFMENLKYIDILRDKLELLRQRLLLDLQQIFPKTKSHGPDAFTLQEVGRSSEEAAFNLLVEDVALSLHQAAEGIRVETCPFYETAVFEGAQGVLLDEYNGFHPHTTWSTVTMRHAQELIAITKPDAVLNIGVVRPYMTRHGAGPLPTEDKELTKIVNDVGNPWNEWQETFRAGWLDLELVKYAAKVCGGELDYLAVNCLDHLSNLEPKIGLRIKGFDSHDYRLNESEYDNETLSTCGGTIFDSSMKYIMKQLGNIAPIGIISDGPTYESRQLTDKFQEDLKIKWK